MKKLPSIKAIKLALITIICFISFGMYSKKPELSMTFNTVLQQYAEQHELQKITVEIASIEGIVEEPIVYNGLTLTELSAQLDKSLRSTLSGYGYSFAKLSIDYEIDPYVAVAIVLLETGCNSGTCSTLCSQCNNVGGMKGSPGCGGGSYKKFNTLDEGIEAYIKNLSNNYYKKGLTTIEAIGKKYAESSSWASKVHYYVNKIKNA